jgi:hypothetical protein
LLSRFLKDPEWESVCTPIEHIDEAGNRVASWPDMYPLEKIDRIKASYAKTGKIETFEKEFMCRASAPETNAFKEEHLRFSDISRTWEPVYVIYDPARTAVTGKSCATGKVAASWVWGKVVGVGGDSGLLAA